MPCFSPSGKAYDPIYTSSIRPNNIDLHTVYTAPNKILTLISVTPFWAVSLKLVRYVRWDPGDICLLLRYVYPSISLLCHVVPIPWSLAWKRSDRSGE